MIGAIIMPGVIVTATIAGASAFACVYPAASSCGVRIGAAAGAIGNATSPGANEGSGAPPPFFNTPAADPAHALYQPGEPVRTPELTADLMVAGEQPFRIILLLGGEQPAVVRTPGCLAPVFFEEAHLR